MRAPDGTAAHIERIAAILGIKAKCRLMHREGFEDDGEWFPPYDEYEVRANGRVLAMDAESIDNRHDQGAVFDLIVDSLRHTFK